MTETMAAWAPRALSVFRMITGLMIIQHGMAKLIGFPAVPAFANLQPLSMIGAAGFLELIGGALLILGLLTQPVAFILAGEMAFAYFIAHAPKSFYPLVNGGTLRSPRIATAVRDPAGKVVRRIPAPVNGRLPISAELRSNIVHALYDVPISGTGAGAFAGFPLDVVRVGGKTGTAQAGLNPLHDTSWFASFAGQSSLLVDQNLKSLLCPLKLPPCNLLHGDRICLRVEEQEHSMIRPPDVFLG